MDKPSAIIAYVDDCFGPITASDKRYWYLLGYRIPKNAVVTVCSRSGLCYRGVITGIGKDKVQIREESITHGGVIASVVETILEVDAIEALQQHISTITERASG